MIGVDGMTDHPLADRGCRVCDGGGWPDDGDHAAAYVPCVCTGRCPKDVVEKVRKSYPAAAAAYLGD